MATKSLPREVINRRNAVYAVFFLSGVATATYLARLPVLRDNLELSTLQVGFFLLGWASGAVVGLTFSSHIIARFGERRTIRAMLSMAFLAMGTVGFVTVWFPSFALAFAIVLVFGFGMSVTDVAMNVEGALVEHAVAKPIMPWFHAFFSAGTVAGAGVAALVSLVGLGVDGHFGIGALLSGPLGWWVARYLGESSPASPSMPEEPRTRAGLAVWLEPRTLAVGLVGLGMAFAEGSANDWLPLAMVDDRGFSNAQAALWFMLFTGSMTVGRILGVSLLERFGRVRILQGSSLAAITGLLVLILVDSLPAAIVAVIAWGLGSALGFPVAMSAAADDPVKGPARVSVVATIAYGAFLVGPPLIGGLAEQVGVLNALSIVAVVVAVGFLAIPSTKERSL